MNDVYIHIYEKLAHLQGLLHKQQMFDRVEYGPFGDRSRGQGRVLAMLKIQPQISTKDLSYLLGIRQQSLNETLNKLEKAGYVERRPSDKDKRILLVHLTEKGKEAQPPENDYSDLFSCLTDNELEAFGDYLDRIISCLETKVKAFCSAENRSAWDRRVREHMGEEQFDALMKKHLDSCDGRFERASRETMPPFYPKGGCKKNWK